MEKIFDTNGLVQFDPNLPAGRLDFGHIIFLDFDGVLHPEACDASLEFMYAENFCQVMSETDPAGEMPVVITSMWRFYETLDQLRSHLSPAIRRQVVGCTPSLSAASKSVSYGWGDQMSSDIAFGLRQKEIEQWLRDYAPAAQWLAIDDRPDAFCVDCPDLFLVPGLYDDKGGLDDPQA